MAKHQISQGFALRRGQSPYSHAIGGTHDLKGAHCPNCEKSLIQHARIDCSDLRLNLTPVGVPTLPLLYCMRCELAFRDFVYRVASANSISLEQVNRGATIDDWYVELGVDSFPEVPLELVAVPGRVEQLFDRLNADEKLSARDEQEICNFTGNYARPEVGGYPIVDVINQFGGRSFLCQRLEDPQCQRCSGRMYFLASITNDPRNDIKITFAGVQIVFFICINCRTIHVQHSV